MIILAAGTGSRLAPLTDDRPKCLVELGGRPLLDWQLESARALGIDDVTVVGGYRAAQLRDCDVTLLENPDFATTNMVRSLFRARERFGAGFIVSYGDIVYTPAVLHRLLDSTAPIGIVVDRAWRGYWEARFEDPLSDAESLTIGPGGRIVNIGQPASNLDEIEAQYIGLSLFRDAGVDALCDAYARAEAAEAAGARPFGGTRALDGLYMTDLIQGMIDGGTPVTAVPIEGGWLEIDSMSDLALAGRLLAQGRLDGAASTNAKEAIAG